MKTRFKLLTIILFTALVVALSSCSDSGNALRSELQKIADETNAQMPIEYDEYTRLDSLTVVADSTLQYDYTLVQTDMNVIAQETIDSMMPGIKAEQINMLKSMPETKFFIENDVTIIYNYVDINGAPVTRIEITPEDYK